MSKKSDELIKKYLSNTCTPEERAMVESWYNSEAGAAESKEEKFDYEHLDSEIWASISKADQHPKRTNWRLIAATAACIVLCGLFYYYPMQKNDARNTSVAAATPLLPGSNKAELLLEDGSVLTLSDGKAGLVTQQNGVVVSRLENGRLHYESASPTSGSKISFNILRTPRGGQYQIDLPDGTRAWLNAASSLKFPTVFSEDERIVEITGEVYFEVAVNKRKPFKVKSTAQTVEVLGTHFNVNAYPDEASTRTTLLEGSVKVTTEGHSVVIRPGEQSMVNDSSHKINIYQADVEEDMAWKQGYFQFNNEDIKSIMRKLSRWYDIEVLYSKDFVNQQFSGSVSRFEGAAKVLKMLEFTGTVQFKIEGRRVTVMP
jgi:transmembrane sensor